MLLSVAAFLMTTVDAGTRLARFSWQELMPKKSVAHNMYVGTFIVCALAAGLLLGNPKAAKQLWTLFASANQLLASLTLLTATLWFFMNRKGRWSWITGVPMVFMFSVSSWALGAILVKSWKNGQMIQLVSSGFLLTLAAALVVITARRVLSGKSSAPAEVK